jgi:alpha-maltose-1-phosphate synthase
MNCGFRNAVVTPLAGRISSPLAPSAGDISDRVAIHFNAYNYDASRQALMGMHVANAAFLAAFARYGTPMRCSGFCAREEDFRAFEKTVRDAAGRPDLPCTRVPPGDHAALARAELLYVPDASVAQFAWTRRRFDQRAYSVCGITHTISDPRAMSSFAELVTAPLQPWDALICTSRAVHKAVETLCEAWTEYLCARLRGRPGRASLRLPVIPLGVDTSAFPERHEAIGVREQWRERLGILPDACTFLFSGRLSYDTKANPTPMYQALEAAAAATGRPVHLIHYGWFATKETEASFKQAARTLCPSISCHFVDGSGPGGGPHSGIWYAADVFTSLADNIQESFGLTPLEAMASGLPVVVSDWDGYRDTVRRGEDGFTIPTMTPPASMGGDLARFFEAGLLDHSSYVGNASLATSVDTAACARAYRSLIENEALRHRMGEAGQRRARAEYDWKAIISRYRELWAELACARLDRENTEIVPVPSGGTPNPMRPDPFTFFEGFATRSIRRDDLIAKTVPDLVSSYERRAGLRINGHGVVAIGIEASRRALLELVAVRQPCTVASLLEQVPRGRHPLAVRTLAWLAKIGLISIAGHNHMDENHPEPGA